MQLDHFNIAGPMALLEEVRDFYVNVLGFEEGFRPAFSRPGFWLYAEERPLLHLIESDSHCAAERQGYLDHVAFRTSGLSAMLERLERHGVACRRSFISEFEMTQLFISDPAGNRLELSFPGET